MKNKIREDKNNKHDKKKKRDSIKTLRRSKERIQVLKEDIRRFGTNRFLVFR